MKIPGIVIAASASGSGKTAVTMAMMKAFKNAGKKVRACKCGPDYIDPMFHTQVIGTKSRNLDTFFTGEEITRYLLAKNSADCEIAVMEGVMGFYDGVAGTTTLASAYDLARVTDTPVILIVNSKGMSVSLAAYIKGFLEYKKDSRIKGVIFNQMSPMLYPRMKKLVEEELGIKVLGYVPRVEDCVIESRHLGLILPEEIPELKGRLLKLAEVLENSLEIEEILKLANEAPVLEYPLLEKTDERSLCQPSGTSAIAEKVKREVDVLTEMSQVYTWKSPGKLRIGLAKDEAFCFFYEDNLDFLRSMGAELVAFSPVHDGHLPENLDGLLLYGGYPELNGKELEKCDKNFKEMAHKAYSTAEMIESAYTLADCCQALAEKIIDEQYSKRAEEHKKALTAYIQAAYDISGNIYQTADACYPTGCGSAGNVIGKDTAARKARTIVEDYIRALKAQAN